MDWLENQFLSTEVTSVISHSIFLIIFDPVSKVGKRAE
jgi:hypothetical protein